MDLRRESMSDHAERLKKLAREYNCAPVTPACLAGAAALTRVAELEADIKAASGAFAMPMPQPGTDMAKMMISNRLLVRRAEKAETDRDRLATEAESYHRIAAEKHNEVRALREALLIVQHYPGLEEFLAHACAKALAGPAPEGGAG